MSQHEDVYDLPQKERKPFNENGNYTLLIEPGDDDWEIEPEELERLENEGGLGNQET